MNPPPPPALAAPRPHTVVAMPPNPQRLGAWFWKGPMTPQNNGSPAQAPAGTVSPSQRQKSAPLGVKLPPAAGGAGGDVCLRTKLAPKKPELETRGRELGLHDPHAPPTTRPAKRPVAQARNVPGSNRRGGLNTRGSPRSPAGKGRRNHRRPTPPHSHVPRTPAAGRTLALREKWQTPPETTSEGGGKVGQGQLQKRSPPPSRGPRTDTGPRAAQTPDDGGRRGKPRSILTREGRGAGKGAEAACEDVS